MGAVLANSTLGAGWASGQLGLWLCRLETDLSRLVAMTCVISMANELLSVFITRTWNDTLLECRKSIGALCTWSYGAKAWLSSIDQRLVTVQLFMEGGSSQ
jgi:hypothetical protein